MTAEKAVVSQELKERVWSQVGGYVKPQNPLVKLIPQCKTYEEFVEFTKTDLYKQLMDHTNPLHKPKMMPKLEKNYNKLLADRKRFLEGPNIPLYLKTPGWRLWYRSTWAALLSISAYSFYNVFFILRDN